MLIAYRLSKLSVQLNKVLDCREPEPMGLTTNTRSAYG